MDGNEPMIATFTAHQAELIELCRKHHVRRLDVFGSAAGSEFDPERSDFDFLVEFDELPPGGYANAFFGLKEDLERLLGRPVDLVILSAIRNPYFRQSIEANREPLYAA
jgi:predicted nucleotidyltransferase